MSSPPPPVCFAPGPPHSCVQHYMAPEVLVCPLKDDPNENKGEGSVTLNMAQPPPRRLCRCLQAAQDGARAHLPLAWAGLCKRSLHKPAQGCCVAALRRCSGPGLLCAQLRPCAPATTALSTTCMPAAEVKRLHYTSSVDTWAVGCLAYELVRPPRPGACVFRSAG